MREIHKKEDTIWRELGRDSSERRRSYPLR
jgi:hypothetical protein